MITSTATEPVFFVRRLSPLGAVFAMFFVLLSLVWGATEVRSADVVFWNKLGSDPEVLASEVGPGLEFYDKTTHGGSGIDYEGSRSYLPGVFGNAVALSGGPYPTFARVHNLVLVNPGALVSPERGTIEAWYMQTSDPVPYLHNCFRIFDGPFGFSPGIWLASNDADSGQPRLYFVLSFGGTGVQVVSLADGLDGHDISPHNGTWIHIAGVWDRNGIGGTAETVRLHVNGEKVAVATQNTWGGSIGPMVDIAGANDNTSELFFVDNLVIRDRAITDFSHRFDESPFRCPEHPDPASQGYWHRQCLGVPASEGGIDPGRNGRGPSSPTEPGFVETLIPCAEARLEQLGCCYGDTVCEGLDADPPSDPCERARKQLTALTLNLCSGRLEDGCSVDLTEQGCGAKTVHDLIAQIDDLVSAGQCDVAAACVGAVNQGHGLAEGVSRGASAGANSAPAAAPKPRPSPVPVRNLRRNAGG